MRAHTAIPSDRMFAAGRWSVGLALLAWAVAALPLPVVALAGGAVGGGIALLRWPWLAWPSLAVVLPVTSAVKWGPLSVTDLILAMAVGLWFADGVRRRSLRLHGSGLLSLLGLYVVALLLSLSRAVDLGEAVAEVIKWAEVFLVVLLVGQSLSPDRRRWLAVALLLGAVGQAALGIYQFIFRIGPEFFTILGRFMRASGSFRQPNPFAGYLGLSLPVAVSLALYGIRRVAGGERRVASGGRLSVSGWSSLWATLFFGGAALAIGLGLLASWSRGGWLGAIVGVGSVLVLRSRRALLIGVIVLALLAGTMLLGGLDLDIVPAPVAARVADLPAYLGLTDVMDQPLTDENFSVQERLAHWIAAVRMWERSPWLGVGPGNYAAVYPTVRLPAWEEPLGHAHNIYLNVLAETGLVGLAAYLALWGGAAVWIWRRLRREEGYNAALALGVLGAVGHLSVHNLFDNLFVQGIYLQVALWLAVLQSHTIDHTVNSA